MARIVVLGAGLGGMSAAFVALWRPPRRGRAQEHRGGGDRSRGFLAKIAFEKYFIHKMKSGVSEPIYEKYVMKALGIERIKPGTGEA